MLCRYRLPRLLPSILRDDYQAMLHARDFRYYRSQWADSSAARSKAAPVNSFQSCLLAGLVFYFNLQIRRKLFNDFFNNL